MRPPFPFRSSSLRSDLGPAAAVVRSAPWWLALLLTGCASVSVQPLDEAGGAGSGRTRRPARLVVEAFSFPDPAAVRVDRAGPELAAFEANLQTTFRDALAKELRPLGLPVQTVGAGPDVPAGSGSRSGTGSRPEPAWRVAGQFTRVNQGSRGLRIVVGLGAGGTKMETAVQVFDLSAGDRPLVAAFRTTGGSNAEPGLIGAGGPVSGPVGIAFTAASTVATVAGSGAHGVTEDARRTAREVAAYLSEELARRGYLDPARVKAAKRLGGGVARASAPAR